MPRKLLDADGNEFEVPTDEEITAMKDGQAKATELETKLKEAEEAANPNWAAARQRMAVLEGENKRLAALHARGKTLNDKGEVVDYENKVTPEMIDQRASASASEAVKRAMVEQRVADHLSSFDAEGAKVIKYYFDKLSAGEALDTIKVDEIMDAAVNAAGIGQRSNAAKRTMGISGVGQRGKPVEKENFAETEAGTGLASTMGLRFLNEKK